MVIGYHLVWTAYGTWLPNDPRGSFSRSIASDVIAQLGELHYGRKKVQPASKDIRAFYRRARDVLKHPLLEFTAPETAAIADSFARAIKDNVYTCYACAIMRDHVHILIRKHKHQAEDMIANLQNASRVAVAALRPQMADHPVWGGPGWKVYLDCPDDIHRTIRYIEQNPPRQHMSPQKWGFILPYDNWPLHSGHNLNSPHARAIRQAGLGV